MSKNRIIAILVIFLTVGGMFFVAKARNVKKEVKTTDQIHKEVGIPIQTAVVQLGRIADTVPVTGDITALENVTLSSKISAKVAYVTVREGDPVKKGQVVVQLDRTDAEAALRQAQAGLQSALARLSQARTSASVTTVQSDAAISQAKAALDAAEAQYKKIKNGARSQELLIAKSQVSTAEANFNNASTTLKRYEKLYKAGAIAEAQLDTYRTQYDIAQAQLNSAKQNLSLVEEGARNEDVKTAAMQVTQAKEALRTAKANAAQNALRQEDIRNAEAGVAQAEAAVAIAKEQLSNTQIVSTIDGYIAKRSTEPGQLATPGAPLIQVVDLKTVYYQANVSETILEKIKPGQQVIVTVDAYPDRSFTGKIDKIYPTAAANTRNFGVRISVPNPDLKLKPGMFARGSIVIGNNSGAILIPLDAIEERNGQNIVFTVDGNTVKLVPIKKGLSNETYAEALAGTDIGPGDVVATSGHENLQDGSKIYIPGQKQEDKKSR